MPFWLKRFGNFQSPPARPDRNSTTSTVVLLNCASPGFSDALGVPARMFFFLARAYWPQFLSAVVRILGPFKAPCAFPHNPRCVKGLWPFKVLPHKSLWLLVKALCAFAAPHLLHLRRHHQSIRLFLQSPAPCCSRALPVEQRLQYS